jgi:hypothetical protein
MRRHKIGHLFYGKIPAKIQHRDLAHFAANALTPHQTVREIGLASGGIVSFCFAYIHTCHYRKCNKKTIIYKILWHNKMILKTTKNKSAYKS